MKEIDPNFTYKESQEHYITHSVLQIGTNKIMIAEQAVDSTRPWQLSNSSSLCIQSKDFQTIEALYHNLIQHDEVYILTPFEKTPSALVTPLCEILWNSNTIDCYKT